MTADRRSDEQIRLLEGRGATCLHGPVIRTDPVDNTEAIRSATEALAADPPDLLVLTTGLGVRKWRAAADELGFADAYGRLFAGATLWARGPKAARAIRELGEEPAWQAPGATYDDVVDEFGRLSGREGASVGVQVDGAGAVGLCGRLEELGAVVSRVPLYMWSIPERTDAAEGLVRAAVERELDAVTFTAKPAVENLFEIADRIGALEELVGAFSSDVAAVCVGPVCAGGFEPYPTIEPLVPERHRLGAMVSLMCDHLARA